MGVKVEATFKKLVEAMRPVKGEPWGGGSTAGPMLCC